MYVVYKHTTPSGKVYIGITGQKPEKRWKNGNGYKDNEHFYRAILKYGWENIKHEIVKDGLTKEQACDLEIELIAKYDSTNPDKGYNNTMGGEANIPSKETRKKMSEALKGANNPMYGKHISVETRQKLSEANKGANNPFYGKHPSHGARRKMSEAKKGARLSPETCRKMSEAHKGTHHSPETRRKMSESLKGKTAKAVICVETGILYSSGIEAAKSIGRAQSSISMALRGATKTSGGYHWRYADDRR